MNPFGNKFANRNEGGDGHARPVPPFALMLRQDFDGTTVQPSLFNREKKEFVSEMNLDYSQNYFNFVNIKLIFVKVMWKI